MLHDRGLGARPEGRAGLEGHESHQDHLAIYAYNGNEYLEAMLGAYKARVAPVNVNYRYVAEELRYLLADSGARAIVFHSRVRPDAGRGAARPARRCTVLLQIADDCGNDLLPGAEWYEEALAARQRRAPGVGRRVVARRPLHPLHRRHHRHAQGRAVAPGRHLPHGDGRPQPGAPREPWASLDELAAKRRRRRRWSCCRRRRSCTAPATGSPSSRTMGGSTVVIQDVVDRLDPKDICSIVEREKVNFLQLVGDAFGRPIVEEMETRRLGRVVAVHRAVGRRARCRPG